MQQMQPSKLLTGQRVAGRVCLRSRFSISEGLKSLANRKVFSLFDKSGKLLFLSLITALVIFPGCAGVGKLMRFENLGGYAPSLAPIKNRAYKVLGKATAKASTYNMFFLANVTEDPNFDIVKAEMVQSLNGDDVIEIYWTTEVDVWLIGSVHTLRFYGKVIKYL